MTIRSAALLALLTTAGIGACGEKQDPVRHDFLDASGPVTWCEVGPIFTTVCTQCHSVSNQGDARNGAPPEINFDTYSDAVDNLDRANVNIQAGTMPPTGGIPPEERNLIQWWVDQNTPACGN